MQYQHVFEVAFTFTSEKLEEIEYVRESDNKKWHFYDIIAQKKVGDKHE